MFLQRLKKKLSNIEYRTHFVSAQVRHLVTAQIKALRELRQWTQGELGKRAGMKPNAISRLENPQYGDFTINTLLRLAKAFDVGLIVRFAPFSELATWNERVSTASYTPASFADEISTERAVVRTRIVHDDFYRPHHIVSPAPMQVSSSAQVLPAMFTETQSLYSGADMKQQGNQYVI